MARRKRKSSQNFPVQSTWLITFSDLVTLVLTFFVLLLSMSSMDVVKLTRISAYLGSVSEDQRAAGKISTQLQVVVQLLQDPDSVLEEQDRIKDLLFGDIPLPSGMNEGDVKKNIVLLQHPQGVVIVLTDKLLYPTGEYGLSETGKNFVDALAPVILASNTDVNISGHTDSGPVEHMSLYELSTLRALAVLERLLGDKIERDRFSLSAYGPDKPLYPNNSDANKAKNRRIEILLKTDKRFGKYV